MKRVLAALCACVIGYGAAVAVLAVERPLDAPDFAVPFVWWCYKDSPTILVFPFKVEGSWTAPIVLRDEESCERFRLTVPVDDLMRRSFCAPLAMLHGASYLGLDREHLVVSPTGVWFYQR